MLRSEFLALVPVTLWTAACGDTEPKPIGVAGSGGAGGSHAAANGSGGVSSQASAGSTAGASGSSSGNGGSGAGGKAGSIGGAGANTAQGGSGGASAAVCPGVEASVGAFAFAVDFSPNSETGKPDPHTLLMNRGAMFRQQVDYSTTGDDHTHQVVFTLEQLSALMGGQTVVVQTEGPPLNASSGHSHTLTVHPCPAANP